MLAALLVHALHEPATTEGSVEKSSQHKAVEEERLPSSHVGWFMSVRPESHLRSQLSPSEMVAVTPVQTLLPKCPLAGAVTGDTSQLLGVHWSVSLEKEPGT